MMADVVSFRPSQQEIDVVEKTRRALGLKSRAEAIRYLIRRGAERTGAISEDPVFQFRVTPSHRLRKGLTSREIDQELYGGSR